MSPSPVTITGTVIDEGGERLGEAVVRLFSPSGKALANVRTDREGRFSLRLEVEPGEYRLEVLFPGFSTIPKVVEVKRENEEKTIFLMLRHDSSRPLKIAAEKRESGIASLGDLPWGSHLCQFCYKKKDMLDTLVPYFKAGLVNNELCVWVTSEFLTKEQALMAMEKAVPGFSVYLTKAQMEIVSYREWYLKGGRFDIQRTLEMCMEKCDQAFSNGFAGLRASGNPYWIYNKKDWDDFVRYEEELNKVISGANVLALCTYSLKRCSAADVFDVIKNHQFILSEKLGCPFQRIA